MIRPGSSNGGAGAYWRELASGCCWRGYAAGREEGLGAEMRALRAGMRAPVPLPAVQSLLGDARFCQRGTLSTALRLEVF